MSNHRFVKIDDTTSFRDHDSYVVDQDALRHLYSCDGDRITIFAATVTNDENLLLSPGTRPRGQRIGRTLGERDAQERIRTALGLSKAE